MNNINQIDIDEFSMWKSNPVTKELFREITEDCQHLQRLWAKGDLINDPINNARRIGAVEALSSILGYCPESLRESYEKNN